MSKKICILILAIAGLAFQSCSYDDQPLWDAVEDLNSRVDQLEDAVKGMNGDLAELQKLVAALQNNVTVTEVNPRGNGYEIRFSDGSMIVIRNGKDGHDGKDGQDGQDGKDAPVISIKLDVDGVYYWTIDGKWLLDGHGNKMPVEGKQGEDGKDAPIPQLRINKETAEWEISVDGGLTWEKTGMFVDSESDTPQIFTGVDNSNPDFVIITLFDGTEIKVDRYTEDDLSFVIEGAEGVQYFKNGATKTYQVTSTGVADYFISKPDGWKVSYKDSQIVVTALDEGDSYGETSGVVAFNLVSEKGKSMIVKMEVEIRNFVLKVLTFEDEDWAGTPFTLDYCGVTVNTWSDLIDDPQNMGPMLYGDTQNAMYTWFDENNTELTHTFPQNWGSYCYWGGGHAISNYVEADINKGDYTIQLSVPTVDPVTGKGGHNGSGNFCVHFGYGSDPSGIEMSPNLPTIMFADGVARVIDHLYITNVTYTLHSLIYGDGFAHKIEDGDYYMVEAIALDENMEICGRSQIMLADGPQKIVQEWVKWDLSGLGKVAAIQFNPSGSIANDFGLSTPAYFAYDDVAVRMDIEE